MRRLKNLVWCAALLSCAVATSVHAASSLSNSLTGFTGDTLNASTQSALTAAGLEITDVTPPFLNDNGTPGDPSDDFTQDSRIVFGANGATYGSLTPGDAGRNYLRTIDSYAFNSYVAEVTVTVDKLGTDQAWMGMGSGIMVAWGVPDTWAVPTVFLTPETHSLSSNANDGVGGDWYNPPACTTAWCSTKDAPGDYASNGVVDAAAYTLWRSTLGNFDDGVDPYDPATEDMTANGDNTGASQNRIDAADYDVWRANFGKDTLGANSATTYRLRMTLDAPTKTWVGSIDLNYTGGPFVADITTPAYDLSDSYEGGAGGFAVNGFPVNPSKIYFGGDDGVVFKDLSITVTDAPVGAGAAVPEPSILALLACAVSGALAARRQR